LTILPIVDRELRVAARGKATYRLRILFAVGAVALAGIIGFFLGRDFSPINSQMGLIIFKALSWIAVLFACLAGVFLTADCLSEEKREGTLGLLFLTDLRGHDVVLGKLFATSLRSFYSLLAIFPVMAVAFVLGGVTEAEFWRSLLGICNILFFSLAIGMLISVGSRHAHKAMTATAAAIGIFIFIPFVLAQDFATGGMATIPLVAQLSPFFAFMYADSLSATDFWQSLAAVHVTAWICLGVASWLAPKTWQEKGIRAGRRWRLGPARGRLAGEAGRKLRDLNPVCWIIARDRWTAYLARMAVLGAVVLLVISVASEFKNFSGATTAAESKSAIVGLVGNSLFLFVNGCSSVLSIVLEFWLMAQVCRFYVEGRKSGFLELLLVTPIRPRDIFQAHWLALRRLFLPALAAQILLALACGIIQALAISSRMPAGASAGRGIPFEIEQWVALGVGLVSWSVGLFALVWFSMWMGMTSSKMTLAMLKTFCFVKVIPWFAAIIVTGFVTLAAAPFGLLASFNWLVPCLPAILLIVMNFALIYLARRRAQSIIAIWSNASAA
jgi:ABC-type transport system involved in multi-copper enzyme maturation permease subunit